MRLLPYIPELQPYEEGDGIFFFGREAERDEIVTQMNNSRLTILYGQSGVGKTSLLQAGVVNYLKAFGDRNRQNYNIGFPKKAVAIFQFQYLAKPNKKLLKQEIFDILLNKLRKAVIEAMDCKKIQFKEQLAKKEQEWKKKQNVLDFIEQLKILADIIQGELFIILDQFENYFQYHPQNRKNFDKEFVSIVNRDDLPIHLLVSIRSDQLYRFEEYFGGRILASRKTSISLTSLTRKTATEAIKRPIERYNFIQHLRNFTLTILCGKKNSGKSLFLQGYLYRYLKDNEDFKFKIVYFHDWQEPNNNWQEIKELINKYKNPIFKDKTKARSLLIIFDQCDHYFSQNYSIFHDIFFQELEISQNSENIKFVIAIRKIDYFKKDIEKLVLNNVHFCSGYFNLADNSIEYISFLQQEKKVVFSLAKFGKNEKEANELQNNIAKILGYPKIAAPYLQLIMCEWWEASKLAITKNGEFILSLDTLRKSGNLDHKKIDNLDKKNKNLEIRKSIKGIIDKYIEAVIKKATKSIESNGRPQKNEPDDPVAFTTERQIYRFLYNLYALSRRKRDKERNITLDYINQATEILRLPIPQLTQEQVDKYLDYFTQKRVLQPVAVGSTPSIYYEIFFEALIPGIEPYQKKYIDYIRLLQKHQELPTISLARLRGNKSSLAALLAVEGYEYNKKKRQEIESQQKYTKELMRETKKHLIPRYKIEESLREILKSSHFMSCRLALHSEDWSNEEEHQDRQEQKQKRQKDFRQVVFSPKGTRLAASNQNGYLGFLDTTKKETYLKRGVQSELQEQKHPHDPNFFTTMPYRYLDTAITFIDEDHFVSVARDKTIKVWEINDFPEYKLLHEIREEKEFVEEFVAVAFNAKKKLLAVSSWEGNIRLWDLNKYEAPKFIETESLPEYTPQNEQELEDNQEQSKNWIWSISFDLNGNFLAAGGRDRIVRLWKIGQGNDKKLQKLSKLEAHSEEVLCVAFSADGNWLASGSKDKKIYLWDVSELSKNNSDETIDKRPKFSLQGHQDTVRTIAFNICKSDDSSKLSSTLLVSGSEDQTIRVWELDREILKKYEEKKGAFHFCKSITQSNDNQRGSAPLKKANVQNWDAPEKRDAGIVLNDHNHGISSLVFNPKDPQLLVSCSWDRTIRFWHLYGYLNEPKRFKEHRINKKNIDVIAASFIKKNDIVIGYKDGHILRRNTTQSWDSEPTVKWNLKVFNSSDKDTNNSEIDAIAFFQKDGKLKKIALSNKGNIEIWLYNEDIEDIWKSSGKISTAYQVKSLSFNYDGTKLAFSGQKLNKDQWNVEVWDVSKPKPKKHCKFPENEKHLITSVVFSPVDNNVLAVAINVKPEKKDEEKGLIQLCNVEKSNSDDNYKTSESNPFLVAEGDHQKFYGGIAPIILAFSPNGEKLASGSDSYYINLWEVPSELKYLPTGQTPKRLTPKFLPKDQNNNNLPTDNFWITSLAFATNNKLASGSYDGTIQIWDLLNVDDEKTKSALDTENVDEPSDKPIILKQHQERVNSLAFNDDGKQLVSVSNDNNDKKLLIWTIPTDQLVEKLKDRLYRGLTGEEKQEYLE